MASFDEQEIVAYIAAEQKTINKLNLKTGSSRFW